MDDHYIIGILLYLMVMLFLTYQIYIHVSDPKTRYALIMSQLVLPP